MLAAQRRASVHKLVRRHRIAVAQWRSLARRRSLEGLFCVAMIATLSMVTGLEALPATREADRGAGFGAVAGWTTDAKLRAWSGDAPSWSTKELTRLTPAEIAVATAFNQLGKPYRYGGVGPSSFDCSGLTRFAWKAAGVDLPHNSGAQLGVTKRVSLHHLRPGDIVFSPGHVGIYIGDGRMIHAPQTGRSVEIAPLHDNAYAGGRPIVRK